MYMLSNDLWNVLSHNGTPTQELGSRSMRISVDFRNLDCVYTVHRRSRSASVRVAFEDATLTQCDLSFTAYESMTQFMPARYMCICALMH